MCSSSQFTAVKIHIVWKASTGLCSCYRLLKLPSHFKDPYQRRLYHFSIWELHRTNQSNRKVLTILRKMQDIQYQLFKCSLLSTFQKKMTCKKNLGNLSIVQMLFPPHPLQYTFNKLEALYYLKILYNINS